MDELLEIMRRLRAPATGCPWDRDQTMRTIVPHTLEEAYEVADCIERDDLQSLPAELGDLLFQVVFYCQIATEHGDFGFDEVVAALSEKLVRRHPHVFAAAKAGTAAQLSERWEGFKAAERRTHEDGRYGSELDGVPRALPALVRAQKMQKRASRVGFDWRVVEPVFAKVSEEFEELKQALSSGENGDRLEDEMGDLLFACVNLARHVGVDAEAALRRSVAKFERRFRYVERELSARDSSPMAADLAAMDRLWDEAKRREPGGEGETGKAVRPP
jgi:MazG family protein